MSLYFATFSPTGNAGAIKPNRNCNRTSWLAGCEPGWGCSIDSDAPVDFRYSQQPARTRNCQPCCEGFFCPRGLTCMIRKYEQQIKLFEFSNWYYFLKPKLNVLFDHVNSHEVFFY